MTIQQHASFGTSTAELSAASKLAKAWESKNAKNAAKASGISLMALSLAACGGSSETAAVVETPVVETPVVETPVVSGESFILTSAAAGDSLVLTAGDDTVTATSSTLGAADIVLDTSSTDADVMNIAITGDISVTPVVNNIETVNITHSGFTSGTNPTVVDIDVADFTGSTTFNVAVDATTSINEVAISNLATGQTVTAATATIDLDAIDDNAATVVNSSAASATATSTVEVTSAGALTALTVNESTGHLDLDVTTGDLDGSLTVDAAQDADVAADAATSATVTAGRDVTITSLAAAKTVTITAGRDVADAGNDLLDAATSVTITAGREINGVDMDAATTVTLSAAGVDSSATGGADRSSAITGDAMTTLNLSGNGGAVEYDVTGANSDGVTTINVSGDQSVLVETNASTLDSITKIDFNDTTTAGTTTFVLGTTTPDGNIDLSAVDTSVGIRLDVNEASADVLTLANGANLTFNAAQTDIDITAASATAATNTVNIAVDKAGTAATTYAVTALTSTNIKTVNVDLSVDTASTTIGTWDVGAANNLSVTYGANAITAATAITASTVTFSGSGALTLGDTIAVTNFVATDVSGAVTVTVDTGNVVQTGSGADVLTAGDIDVNIQTNGGDDTHNLSGNLSDNSSYVLAMGEGSDTLNVANSSNTNSAAVQLTGFDKIVLAGDATMRDTQLDGITAAVFGGSNSVLTIGMSKAVNDFSGLTVDTATMSTGDSDGFVMNASSLTSAVTITGTGFDDTITGSANASYLADTISAGAGADTINVTSGGDSVTGGGGTDTISFETIDGAFTNIEGGTSDASGMIINMGTTAISSSTVGSNTAFFMSGSDTSLAAGEFGYLFTTNAAANSAVVGTVATVENVTGSTGGDYIVGSTGANTILGGTGDDYITAGTGDDAITGGAGNDTIIGGTGADTFTISGVTAALNGSDTISVFQSDDFLNLAKNGSDSVTLVNATSGTAITLNTVTKLASSGTTIAVADNKLILVEVANKSAVDTIDEMVIALADGGVADAVDIATSAQGYVLIGGADDDTTHFLYGFNTNATAGVIASELALVATITSDITGGIDGLLDTDITFA